MFCKNCGAQLPEGVNFCNVCGAQNVAANQAQPQAQPYVQPQYSVPAYNQPVAAAPKKNVLGIVAIALQIFMIILILAAPMIKPAGEFGEGAESAKFFELYDEYSNEVYERYDDFADSITNAKGATIAGIVCCVAGALLMAVYMSNKNYKLAYGAAAASAIGVICIFVSVFAILSSAFDKLGGFSLTFDGMGWCAMLLGAASVIFSIMAANKDKQTAASANF